MLLQSIILSLLVVVEVVVEFLHLEQMVVLEEQVVLDQEHHFQ